MRVATVLGSRTEDFEVVFDMLDVDVCVIESKADLKHTKKCSHVLLMGGGDLNPNLYGEKASHVRFVDNYRDALDYALCSYGLEHSLPILGVCRGMQMLNVVMGGSLHQDWQLTEVAPHKPFHHLSYVRGSLAWVLPNYLVNSYHHQSVNEVGKGLTVAATALDGTVEALQGAGCLGVQWHPESLVLEDQRWLDLFRYWLKGFGEA
ncbi:MAG: gamma-glutamyl-gamma-aminobutyrate hydrolase family protein [Trueperaceae bacterium]